MNILGISAVVVAVVTLAPRAHAQRPPDEQTAAPSTLTPAMAARAAEATRSAAAPRVELRYRLTLPIAGAALFGMTYTGTAIGAAVARDGWVAIPVVGAFWGAAEMIRASTRCGGFLCDFAAIEGDLGVLMVFDGIAQAAGIVMVVAALVRGPRPMRVANARATTRPQWSIVPGAVGATAGVTVGMIGW